MPLACFKCVDTLLIAIETCRRHVPTLWRLRVSALLMPLKHAEGMSLRYIAFFKFTLPCDGERDFFELEVEVV